VIPASSSRDHSGWIPGTGSAGIIPLPVISRHHSHAGNQQAPFRAVKGYSGAVIPASSSRDHSGR